MISIIIPAWNEEKYLPQLLDSIKNQTYRNYELIVADAGSKDQTVKIAKKYGCKVVKGGMPAVGRNNGAKAASGNILLFLDADVQLDNDFLKNASSEIRKRKIDVAGVYIHPLTNKLIDKIYLKIFNFCVFTTQFFYPNAYGGGIFCKKWLHNKLGGFDETIKLGEDLDYVQRCGKHGKFRIIQTKINFSMRRFEKEGRLKVGVRHVLSAIYRVLFGQIRSDSFKYNLRYKR
ncbi:glycosyltransferase [Candidatus Woesearchaeota archaeon]|nr:glycosyltransferase [Candidatus Woesearchaeota archaeon]